MNEAEEERKDIERSPTASCGIFCEQVLKCGDHDGDRDEHFNPQLRHTDDAQARQCECNAMADSKCRHEDQQVSPLTEGVGCTQCDDKQDVIIAVEIGDMVKAQFQVNAKHRCS